MIFERIGRLATRYRYAIILTWIAITVGLTLLAPNLSDVATSDQAALLPDDAPFNHAADVYEATFPDSAGTGGVVIVVESTDDILNQDAATFPDQIDTVTGNFIAELGAWLISDDGPADVSGITLPVSSPQVAAMSIDESNRVAVIPVNMAGNSIGLDGKFNELADPIHDWLAENQPAGIKTYVTGSTAVTAAFAESAVNTMERTLLVTLVLVVLLLLLIYRSPISPIIPLMAVTMSYLTTRGIVAILADNWLTVSSYADILLVVVIYGAGTDYCLFLISRFREEMADKPGVKQATTTTIEKVGETITSSAGTVFVGFTSMIFAEFGLFSTSGPTLAIGIVVSLIAGLTFVPAMLATLGNVAFWPGTAQHRAGGKFYAMTSNLVAKYPWQVLVVIVLVMTPLGVYGMMAELNYDPLEDLPDDAEAKEGFEVMKDTLGAGNLSPLTVVVTDRDPATLTAEMVQIETDLLALDGVAEVMSLNNPSGHKGNMTHLLRADTQLYLIAQIMGEPVPEGQEPDPETTAAMLEGLRGYVDGLATQFPEVADDPNLITLQTLFADMEAYEQRQREVSGAIEGLAAHFAEIQQPYVPISEMAAAIDPGIPQSAEFTQLLNTYMAADGVSYRMTVILAQAPNSRKSLDTVLDIRDLLEDYENGGEAVVDGQPVIFTDLRDTLNTDLLRTTGIVSLGILVVLLVMLRSVVAPLYLIATVGLSYAFTLGLTDLVFRALFGYGALSFILPIFSFVFLVALGIDYSIFLIGRVKEDVAQHGINEGVHVAVIATGPIITSAGIILAGTFAAMMLGEITALAQLGFAVAVGVLVDTFVVRTMLVPALTILLDKWAWWPGGTPRDQTPKRESLPATGSD